MNRTLSISPDVNDPAFRAMTFDEVREAYEEQVRGLIDGGVDLLLLETIFDTLNAKAAIVAIENVFEEKGVRLPLMISVTITDRSGRTLSGQTLDAFYVSIRTPGRSASASTARSARATCGRTSPSWRGSPSATSACYPNAGLPNAFGEYDELPDETGELLRDFAPAASSTSSAAAAARRRITSRRSRRRSKASARAARASAAAFGCAAAPRAEPRLRLPRPESRRTTRSSPASRR